MDGGTREAGTAEIDSAVRVVNEGAGGRFVILCDHASRAVPAAYGTLGLGPADQERHIAWDPGALPVARHIADTLDAPLVHATVSRLVVDTNRSPDAADFIAPSSEDTAIPGNRSLDAAARRARIETVYEPYHRAIGLVLDRRESDGLESALIAVHTFTPVYRGTSRPWHVGILHDGDMRIARPLIAALACEPAIVVGDNKPYSPADGVYHTLDRHGAARGMATVMIEIRNDLVAGDSGQREWADRLSRALAALDLPARAA